jgi:hypothetical protein
MPPPTPPAANDAVAERLRGRLMQQSLRPLLDRVRGARDVLPHLAALETSLGKHGTAVIATISTNTLAKICSQLSSLPLPADDPPLRDLLTRLLDTLEAQQPTPQFLSTFVGEQTLVIQDGSHSEFMDLENAHADTVRCELEVTPPHLDLQLDKTQP